MNPETEKQFFDLSNSFVKLANEHASAISPAKVSAAMMYAAARFNTYALASAKPEIDEVEALKQLVTQYEDMCRENIADHAARRQTATKE
jgi:hypothetical protein